MEEINYRSSSDSLHMFKQESDSRKKGGFISKSVCVSPKNHLKNASVHLP